MALTELLNKKLEIPIFDIGDFIKKQKESLISTIKTHHKNYVAAENAHKALKSQPPVKPPDGPRYPATPANRPSADANMGYHGIHHLPPVPQKPEVPIIDRYEIPLAKPEDFVQINPPPALSGTTYYPGQRMPEQQQQQQHINYYTEQHNGVNYVRGSAIGNGIFKDPFGRTIKRMEPADPALIEEANYLLETTEEMNTHKLPADHSDIPPNFTVVDPKFREILDIIYKNRRL